MANGWCSAVCAWCDIEIENFSLGENDMATFLFEITIRVA